MKSSLVILIFCNLSSSGPKQSFRASPVALDSDLPPITMTKTDCGGDRTTTLGREQCLLLWYFATLDPCEY
jgi:hypothetical protein